MMGLQAHGAGSCFWYVLIFLARAGGASVSSAHGVLRRESQPNFPHRQVLFASGDATASPSRKTAARLREFWQRQLIPDEMPEVYASWQRGVDLLRKPFDPPIDRVATATLASPTAPVKPIKLLLGVMAISGHDDVHQAHRQTWMQSPGVCQIARRDDPACSVFPVFVLGNISKQQQSTLHFDDYLILKDVPEIKELSGYEGDGGEEKRGRTHKMWLASQFKTPAFFRQAASQFKWATHVGKMDEDTLPNISSVASDLAKLTAMGGEYYYGWKVLADGGYQGKGVMHGSFYLFSSGAASCWLKSDELASLPGNDTLKSTLGHLDPAMLVSAKRFTQPWWTHAEDQVVPNHLVTAQEYGHCPAVRWVSAIRWIHPVN
eukprot:TRINITY_DN17821_c0_g1_i2.p1 TRINITY_DN17821_c0_g1~~TRINITY_DN17821_c0_g1_i2.p1  ORF type:complete len:422 (+),score=54.24 TRINITY_DN17821_c0_g1_i2:140-1267(+)